MILSSKIKSKLSRTGELSLSAIIIESSTFSIDAISLKLGALHILMPSSSFNTSNKSNILFSSTELKTNSPVGISISSALSSTIPLSSDTNKSLALSLIDELNLSFNKSEPSS